MSYDQQKSTRRLREWGTVMQDLCLPAWNELPPLELYMDQVVLLLKQYLEPLIRDQEEKAITASIVNNYVRLKIMPPPVKKKYARTHLAYLIMICVLKQSLSMASIQELLPDQAAEDAIHQVYDDFAAQFRAVSGTMARISCGSQPSLLHGEGDPAVPAAIAAVLTKSLTEHLLRVADGK